MAPGQRRDANGVVCFRVYLFGQNSRRQGVVANPFEDGQSVVQLGQRSSFGDSSFGESKGTDELGIAGYIGHVVRDPMVMIGFVSGQSTNRRVDPSSLFDRSHRSLDPLVMWTEHVHREDREHGTVNDGIGLEMCSRGPESQVRL